MAPSATQPSSQPSSQLPGLSPSQLASFRENGYLVIPDYLDPSEVRSLITETESLLTSFNLDSHPLTTFTTGDDDDDESVKHVGDDYFLTSGDKIRFFFEPDAFSSSPDPATGRPTLLKPKHQSINKIGHSLHHLSEPFRRVSLSERNAAVARSLGFTDPSVLQSMVICKQPGIGGAVPPHRDSEFLYTSPPSAVGWWYALQDAGPGNATLKMWKRSHSGKIKRRFVRAPQGGTEFVENDGPAVPRGAQDTQDGDSDDDHHHPDPGSGFDTEVLDVKAGALVLIHGNVLHSSEKNTSPKSRYAYTFHVIEQGQGWDYDQRNWLQPPETGFSKLYQ